MADTAETERFGTFRSHRVTVILELLQNTTTGVRSKKNRELIVPSVSRPTCLAFQTRGISTGPSATTAFSNSLILNDRPYIYLLRGNTLAKYG